MKLLAGSAHPQLAKKIARKLKISLGKMEISKFPNGEKRIHILENIKNKKVFIVQPTITDENIIELCLIADAAHHKGAKKITAVTPWYGYSPQDKIFRKGEPLSSRVMAKIMEASGINQFIIVDPHSEKIKNFFSVSLLTLSALDIFCAFLKKRMRLNSKNFVVAALDKGDIVRSQRFAKKLKLPLVFLQKTPRDRETGRVEFLSLKGDVKNKNVLVFDDFSSTGQTLVKSAKFLRQNGALKIIACITHYFNIKGLAQTLQKSLISQFITTDTLPLLKRNKFPKLTVVSVAALLAKAIKRC